MFGRPRRTTNSLNKTAGLSAATMPNPDGREWLKPIEETGLLHLTNILMGGKSTWDSGRSAWALQGSLTEVSRKQAISRYTFMAGRNGRAPAAVLIKNGKEWLRSIGKVASTSTEARSAYRAFRFNAATFLALEGALLLNDGINWYKGQLDADIQALVNDEAAAKQAQIVEHKKILAQELFLMAEEACQCSIDRTKENRERLEAEFE